MSEPTRPIRQPTVEADGSVVAHTVATPKAFKVRALMTVPPRKVIPVVFVPGIMGTNLRLRAKAACRELQPGEAAWRPPNGSVNGLIEAKKWERRGPTQRQKILDPDLLEVDTLGELDFPSCSLTEAEMRERGWGEIHAGSYGTLLADLQEHLDTTFELHGQQRKIKQHWQCVMDCDPARWGVRDIARITEAELEKYASFHYPVYAVGYNWLQSCAVSAERLRKYVGAIIKHWSNRKFECTKVILVTHSMGGLVARACAKQIPDQIAGVIHGVMPALGAPVAYRRIACGTEGGSQQEGYLSAMRADKFAEIAGTTPQRTTPVMARSAGVLELLPNNLYPRPWLTVKVVNTVNREEKYRDLLSLPMGNPYDFYRDMHSWYRMIDPALADPSGQYEKKRGGVEKVILRAIAEAEKFHSQVLMTADAADGKDTGKPYYHPNTYAYYGADEGHPAFGQIRWVAYAPVGESAVLTAANIQRAKLLGAADGDAREIEVEGRFRLHFESRLQDAAGDGTVPLQSGAGPAGHVCGLFATRGYAHQESFQHADVLLLTRHLIVKIVQGFA